MKKAPTIHDVAAEAGVSVSVVSRVLNTGTGPVAPRTRERVLGAIDKLAYRPRSAAQSLSLGRASTLGLLLPDLTNPFFGRLADRVVWEARSRGVQVVLMTTQEDEALEAESLDTLLDRSVGVVIATPTGHNVARWKRLIDVGVNVIFVDRTIDELPEVDVVSIENKRSAELSTEYLVGLGHRQIGFITGPSQSSTGRDRVEGYEQVLGAHGIVVDPDLIYPVPFRGDGGSDAVGALLSSASPPTALIVANTAQVRSSLRRLLQADVVIPEELSVVVFDDNPWTELVNPPLTVVRQPIDMLAVHCVELAMGRVRGHLSEGARNITVAAEFVRRSSAVAPRNVDAPRR